MGEGVSNRADMGKTMDSKEAKAILSNQAIPSSKEDILNRFAKPYIIPRPLQVLAQIR